MSFFSRYRFSQAWTLANQASAAFLGLFGVIIMWVVLLHAMSNEREQALQAASQNTGNLARAFSDQIMRTVNAVDQTLRYTRDAYQRDPTGFDIAAWTKNTQVLTDMTFQISLIDKDGMMIASNLDPHPGRVNLGDREHFLVHKNRTEDRLFISKPVLGRASHKWSIQLTRKILTPDGSFNGVIVISLDPIYLSRFYDSIDIGSNGAIGLVGTDGIIRASARGLSSNKTDDELEEDSVIGKSVAGGNLLKAFSHANAGNYIAHSNIDGNQRVMSYRGVPNYPLLVVVGADEKEVLAYHEANQASFFRLATLLSLLFAAVSVLVVVRQVRLNRAKALLQTSEADLAQKSVMLERTLDNMTQGLMMVDADRRVQVCNARAIEMLNLPKDLMASRPLFDDLLRWQWESNEFGHDGRDVEEWLRAFVLSGGMDNKAQVYERVRSNGIALEVRSEPLPDGGLVRTYTDITLRRQTEEALRQARDEADRTAHAKSEFLATMSHEIRSPMSGLLGVLDLLRATDLDADQTHMAQLIHNSSAALLGVLNDILDFSKIEAGALSPTLEAVTLRDLVDEVVAPQRSASKGRVALDLIVADTVPDYVMLDPLRLRQILNNLLSNAVKFTKIGAITINVDLSEAGNQLRFMVADSGVGMSPEVVSRLFQPFMQADSSTTRNYGGTGLGLCISQRLAHLLNGELSASSQVGIGSVFTLSLPLLEATAPKPAPAMTIITIDNRTAGFHVLVADDDLTNRWLTQRQLQRLGLQVDTAADGESAFALLQQHHFDLLVTDCHMPRMDGVALTRAIRHSDDPQLRALPVMGLTADVTETQRERCIEAGMTEIAVKPLSLDRLQRLVSKLLQLPSDLGKPSDDDATASPESAALAESPSHVFDRTSFDELFPPGDEEGADWLADYLSAADQLMAKIRISLPIDEPKAVRRTDLAAAAHRLVGTSLSVGANDLGHCARLLENAAVNAELAILYDLLDALNQHYLNAQQAITDFLITLKLEQAL